MLSNAMLCNGIMEVWEEEEEEWDSSNDGWKFSGTKKEEEEEEKRREEWQMERGFSLSSLTYALV